VIAGAGPWLWRMNVIFSNGGHGRPGDRALLIRVVGLKLPNAGSLPVVVVGLAAVLLLDGSGVWRRVGARVVFSALLLKL